MKTKNWLIGIGLMITLTSWAGGEAGNGGVSVVCRNNAGKISSAQVLDIYEGEVRFGRKYDNVLDADTKVELAQLKLAKHTKFLEEFQEELARVRAIMVFIPKGNRLLPTNDAFPKIEKVGCDFEQLANYTDEIELLVSQEIYDELGEVNKAALLVHETVYALFRKYHDVKDSQLSRKLTAHLLSKNADQKVIDVIIKEEFTGQSPTGLRVCGIKGSVDERIKNCNEMRGNFDLVARTREGKEIYKDSVSGLLWSERLIVRYADRINHHIAERECASARAEMAGLSEFRWRLPSKEEFQEARINGIKTSLPNWNYLDPQPSKYWSSSIKPSEYYPDTIVAWVFGYVTPEGGSYHKLKYTNEVRCVAR